MELVVGLVAIGFFILVLKWVGAWMLGVTNVMDKQDTTIKGLVAMNENLKAILTELKSK